MIFPDRSSNGMTGFSPGLSSFCVKADYCVHGLRADLRRRTRPETIHIGWHAFAALIELPKVESGAAIAGGGRPRVPNRGFRDVARRATAAVEHDRDVECRRRITRFGGAAHRAESRAASGTPCDAVSSDKARSNQTCA